MKNLFVIILLALFSLTAVAQKPKPKPKTSNKLTSTSKKPKNLGGEKEEFEKAVAFAGADERIAALKKFVEYFPNSEEKTHALELVVVARATLADEKLRAGDATGAVEIFKLAVGEAPKPASDKLFTEVLLLIPNNLFFRGERTAAIEVARLVEEKADGNAKQILA
ncbi:MAG: hypothetical protein H0W45_01230, partial [Acidobacteria bacterium]|nr:hypothetical protein [Acidobacteriota bacterium]